MLLVGRLTCGERGQIMDRPIWGDVAVSPPDQMGEIALDSSLHCSLESHVGRSADDAFQFHRENPVQPGQGTSCGRRLEYRSGR